MSRGRVAFTIIVLAVLAVGLFYLRALKRYFSPAATGSQNSDQAARTRLSEAALQPSEGQSQTVTLYFPSYVDGKLVPETRSLSLATQDTKRVRQILLALIEGSRQGHVSTLPPSTTISAVFLMSDGTAVIDLSQGALSNFTPGIESETLAVYSIVDSLAANIPAVKRVKFLIQGHEAQTLDGHIDLTGYFAPEPSLIAQAAQTP